MNKQLAKQIAALPPDVVAAIELRAVEAFIAEVKRESPKTMARILGDVAKLLKPARKGGAK